MPVSMDYCMQCGTKLEMRYHEAEGREIPYCSSCGAYRHPVFSTAVSMIVTDRKREKILLIQQYGRPDYILVAGYVNCGEDAEDAVVREVREEVGLRVTDVHYNHSRYFPRTNTLMLNFTAVVDDEDVKSNEEVDAWRWFTPEEAKENIRPNSLARAFLLGYLNGSYEW